MLAAKPDFYPLGFRLFKSSLLLNEVWSDTYGRGLLFEFKPIQPAEAPACLQCQARGSLVHILNCCPKAMGEGRGGADVIRDQAGQTPAHS